MKGNVRIAMRSAISALLALMLTPPASGQGLNKVGINLLDDRVPLSSEVTHSGLMPWVRIVAFWRGIQWDPNVDDYSELDAQVQAALNQNQSVLINFTSIPWWANGDPVNCDWLVGECTHPPTDPQFFADFVFTTVNRYKDRVKYWEIWNEPDYIAFWNGSVTQFMNTIATPGITALKAADPQAIVLGPSTYENVGKFQTFAAPMCNLIDRTSAHFYFGSTAEMFSRIDSQFLPWISTHCNKPFWITETGVESTVLGEAAQAQNYVAAYTGALSRPAVENMMLFNWCDGSGYGVFEGEDRGFRPKRAFFEIQDYTRSLAGLSNPTVVRDTFANNATTRTVGATLSGTSTELGARSWSANSSLVFGNSEVTTSVGGDTAHVGGIPFNPPIDPQKPINVVEADIIVSGSAFVGIGFSLSAQGGLWGHGQVWAHLGPLGYSVYADGLAHNLANGTIPNFAPSGLNNLRIEHNRSTNRLSVLVNHEIVLQNFNLGTFGFTPSLAFATMHLQTASGSAAGMTKVDNFRVFSQASDKIFSDNFETKLLILWSSQCNGVPPICPNGPTIPGG